MIKYIAHSKKWRDKVNGNTYFSVQVTDLKNNDFDEYENLKKVQDNYTDIKSLDDLRDHTTVIEIPNTDRLIIQAY